MATVFSFDGGGAGHATTGQSGNGAGGPAYGNIVLLPPATAPTVRIASVAGSPSPTRPVGSFTPADVVINESGPVTLGIEASHIPLGTVVHLVLTSESLQHIETDSTPLAGTLAASTATAAVTIPPGFSRFTVQATWTP